MSGLHPLTEESIMKFAFLSTLYWVAGFGLMLHGITQIDPNTVTAGAGLFLLSFVLLVASIVDPERSES